MKPLRTAAIVAGVLIVLILGLPYLVDANSFRPKLESELTSTLGREVKVGNLSLSILTGSVSAEDLSIADDPSFSKDPFVHAKSLKVGVELMPLIFSKSLRVTELTLNQPEIALVRSANGETWNFSTLGSKATPAGAKPAVPATGESSGPANPSLSVSRLNVNHGRLTVSRAGSSTGPHVYDKVDIEVRDFAFSSSFPFTMTANLPAGGSLKLDGKAGPIDAGNSALTPLQAKVSVQQMNLAASGFLDPASGISGQADFDGTVNSDGHSAKTSGTLKASKLQLVQKGSPAGNLVTLQYAVTHDLAKESGTLTQGDLTLGKAVAHLAGSYDNHGSTTSINMQLTGESMPVDDLEAMLPALGVVLPPGSTLKGGTLATNLTIAGPVDKLVTGGTIRLENSSLAGFNLGSKLSAVSALSGKGAGGNDTTIQNFSSEVHVAPDGTRADNINLNVPSIGILTGAGTVSPTGSLDFKMNAALSGSALGGLAQLAGGGGKSGIPFMIQGTTGDPRFVPDVQGMAGGLLKNVLPGGQGQKSGGVMGLFKKKPH